MKTLVTFGEAMIRLSPPGFERLEQTTTLDLHVGGAELNVAVGVSRLGMNAKWVSRLPDNALGRMIANKGREHGVDVSSVVWDRQGRAGLYFLEFGATPRPTSVLYDRARSAFAELGPGQLDWSAILPQAACLHVTGITPAVSKTAAEATVEALAQAKAMGCKVSMDLNYRAKLWTPEQAHATLEPMMASVDVMITTEGDARTILAIEAADDQSLARKLLERYPFEAVAISYRRGDRAWQCDYSAMACTRENTFTTNTYTIDIVDQVGRGDAFAAGFLYGYLAQDDIQLGLDYGVAFAALKHSFPGDLNWCTREEVEALLAGGRIGVQR
jgi:2-dehydro-3-deoxygluconokinase